MPAKKQLWEKCAHPGCDRVGISKKMCDMHYRRWKKRGSSYDRGSHRVDLGDAIQRFHAKYEVDQDTGCWIWVGSTRPASGGRVYGRHHINSKKTEGAHRFSYRLHKGPIGEGNFVCHHCDTPLCVNPSHLFQADHAGNMRDMVKKGRSFKAGGELKVGRAKLTNAQAREIRSARGTQAEIAQQYGVAQTTVSRIKRGKSYADA